MKLLRLTTRERTAIFDAAYQGDLVIPPKSKIALQSVSINADPASLVIDGTNNQITYQLRDGLQRTVTLPDGEYFASTIEIFNRKSTVLFNNSCSITFTGTPATDAILKRLVGIEWQVEKNLNNKEEIGYKLGRQGEYEDKWELNTVERGAFGTPQRLNSYRSSDPTDVSTTNRVMLFPYQMAKGYGYSRCRVGILNFSGDPTTSGFIWGVTRNLDVRADDMTIDDVAFGILVVATTADADQNGKEYRMIVNGVLSTDAPTAMATYGNNATTNEYVEITINGPNLEANIYRNGSGVPERLGGVDASQSFIQGAEQTGDVNNRLQPFCIFRGGSANAVINSVSLTLSPYGAALALSGFDGNEEGVTALPPLPAPVQEYNNFLFFESDTLAFFLGYENRRIPVINFTAAHQLTYEADREMTAPQEADAFLVEMLNMQLDSYDSFSNTLFSAGGQRKNILTVIPSANSAGKVVYEPPYPTFIDISNEQPMFIRNLRARVVRTDYSDIYIRGLATLVILIDTD